MKLDDEIVEEMTYERRLNAIVARNAIEFVAHLSQSVMLTEIEKAELRSEIGDAAYEYLSTKQLTLR